jgi:6-phosphofructokinase 1
MNPCLRAVVKHATHRGLEVIGIRDGGVGLLRASAEDFVPLLSSSLANTLNRGGSILGTSSAAQFEEFLAGRDMGELAKAALERNRIDALILIGGDTTASAALAVSSAFAGRLPVVVIPATIDNDIRGTAETIGFDSAVGMAVSQVDAIRETAAAMDRVFVVEVTGATRGYLAVDVAMATGAEAVLIPEIEYTRAEVQTLVRKLAKRVERDRKSAIVIVAEGARIPSGATASPGQTLIDHLRAEAPSVESSLSVLEDALRAAPPTARTRNLAAKAGGRAVTEVVRQLDELSQEGVPVPPTLIGIHQDGYLKRVDITGDMVRRDEATLIRLVEDEIDVLGF